MAQWLRPGSKCYVLVARWPDDFHILGVFDSLPEAQRIKQQKLGTSYFNLRKLDKLEIYDRMLNVPLPTS